MKNIKTEKRRTTRYWSVIGGYVSKFSQDKRLKEYLLATGSKILVYASTDKEWGIGLPPDSPDTKTLSAWQGENLIGFALMDARSILKAFEEDF